MRFSKPPLGTPINPQLAAEYGLQCFYALNEGTGGLINDAMGNLNLAATGFGATNPWGAASQVVINIISQGKYFQANIPAKLQYNYPISIIRAFRYVGTVGNNAGGFVLSNALSGNFIGMFSYFNPAFSYGYFNGSTWVRVGGSKNATIGIDYVESMTITTTRQSHYVNGVLADSSTSSISNSTWPGTSVTLLGTQSGSVNPNLFTYWAAWSNTAWTPAQHAFLGQNINNIWSLFQPQQSLFGTHFFLPHTTLAYRPPNTPYWS